MVPGGSDGSDGPGSDPLSALLSWGRSEAEPSEAESSRAHEDDAEQADRPLNRPPQPGYGPPPALYGPPEYRPPAYGPPQYGPYWSEAPWPQQWALREPPVPKIPKRPPHSLPGWFGVALLAALVGAAAGGGIVSAFVSRSPQTIVREYFPSTPKNVRVGDVQAILASVLPAVVSIDTSSFRASDGVGGYVQGAGTGMIIEASGVVLTNNHVIAGAETVTVTLYGQTKQFPARVIGTDAQKDIALVQVEGAGRSLPTVRFGDSNRAQQGDGVLAIGNALALAGGPTVTEGIVSAEDRSLTATTDSGGTENLTGLIQTDAPINPGNSGGPLVNSSGQVVAMNTAVATSSQGNAPAQNVGFAIAVDEIRTITTRILQRAGLH